VASRTARLPTAWENEHADPNGSDWLFEQLDGRSESYLQYASEYFERQLPAEAVMAVIEHPLTAALVRALNPERSQHDLTSDLYRIGYPAE
jgi:hypothetical protein